MKRMQYGIFLLSLLIILGGTQACGDSSTTEACLINGDPECSPNPGNGGTTADAGTNDTGAGGNIDSGVGGDGGTGSNCTSNPNFGKFCVTLDGHSGHFICIGEVLTCAPDSDGGLGGDSGMGGDGGGGVYHCAADPLTGTICNVGPPGSVCYNEGINLCYFDLEAPKCSVSPHAPNPAGEICGNGIDDNCDGITDESPCISGGGDGGAGGDGGSGGGGGSDGGSGGGGSGGGATCTTAPLISATILAPTALTSLLKGAGSVDTSDPLIKGLVNNNLLALNASGGISVSINTGKINVFRANSPGGDPTPLIDDLYCRQLGINPPTPASCNMGVIGSRASAAYLSALNVDFQCWRSAGASCVSTISGHIPGDLFALMKVVQNGDSLSQSPFADAYSGVPHFLVTEHPPLCP